MLPVEFVIGNLQRRRGWVGRGKRAPLASEIQEIFGNFKNYISTAHMRYDVIGFDCIRSSEKY